MHTFTSCASVKHKCTVQVDGDSSNMTQLAAVGYFFHLYSPQATTLNPRHRSGWQLPSVPYIHVGRVALQNQANPRPNGQGCHAY